MASWWDRLKSGLARTTKLFDFRSWFGRKVDQSLLDDLEARLIQADVGVKATATILDEIRDRFAEKTADRELTDYLKDRLVELLETDDPGNPAISATEPEAGMPKVLLIAGINGAGKTTSIAKLTKRLTGEGKTVVLAACDTFRAAAADQLAIWAERTGSDLVRGNAGADPASVAHDACQRAIAKKADYLIVDTAGRLHTQDHLMREVEKIRNVISRKIAGAPHECLLVLDATIGQNALKQADVFTKSLKCTGVILTKLDGTAKGGIVIPIRRQLGLPVKFIGVGEGADDLQPFVAREFIQAMIGE
ncbi:MAG: signal recognition particle-docking protein FtsY [bacterium]